MDDQESDVAARGRALFEQLRGTIYPKTSPLSRSRPDPADQDTSGDADATDQSGDADLAESEGGPEQPAPSTSVTATDARHEEPEDPTGAVAVAEPATEAISDGGGALDSSARENSEESRGVAGTDSSDDGEAGPNSDAVAAGDAQAAEVEPGKDPADIADVGNAEPPAATRETIASSASPDTAAEPASVPLTSTDADAAPSDRPADPDVAALAEAPAVSVTPPPDLNAPPPPRPKHPAAELPLPRIIAVANQKGGVGKTTTAVNLGAALAELGYRTLVVDLDPQGNATTGLGVNARNLEHSIYDVLMHDLPLEECLEPTSVRNLFVAPATIDLAGAEIELVPAFSRELRLRRALAENADAYDFTIIDCPPSLGLLTVNGLAAATEVVVPIQCEYYALEGLSQLLRNVNLVQTNLNPTLLLSAIILTMYDARTKLADQVAAEVREHFGPRVCRHVVPRTVRLSEAPSFGQPIIVFDSSSRGALAYRELAKEVSGGAPQRVG